MWTELYLNSATYGVNSSVHDACQRLSRNALGMIAQGLGSGGKSWFVESAKTGEGNNIPPDYPPAAQPGGVIRPARRHRVAADSEYRPALAHCLPLVRPPAR